MTWLSDVFETREFGDREAWLAARDQPIVGASEIATLLGEGYANHSEYSMWCQKALGINPEFKNDDCLWLGNEMEPIVRKMFTRKTGLEVFHDEKPVLRVSKQFPWMVCTLDCWTVEADEYAPVELKYLGIQAMGDFKGDDLPLKYTIQNQYQMAVTGATFGYVGALIGTELRYRKVARHDRLIESMVRISKAFSDSVKNKTPPPIDESQATMAAIVAQYAGGGKNKETCVAFAEGLSEDAKQMIEDEEEIKRLEVSVDRTRNRIRAAIGEASYGYAVDGTTWTWAADKRGVRALKRLAKPPAIVLETLAVELGESIDVFT